MFGVMDRAHKVKTQTADEQYEILYFIRYNIVAPEEYRHKYEDEL